MTPAVFETAIPATERPQTHALDRVATGIGAYYLFRLYEYIIQWPRGLRRGSAAARLLGLRIRIPPGAWLSLVNVVCCHVEVSASG
jgi:hypothetical protein